MSRDPLHGDARADDAPDSSPALAAGSLGLQEAMARAVAVAADGGERAVLEAFLDYLRAAVVAKVADLSEADARRRLVPSATTPAGLPAHLTLVERNWFQITLLGRDPAEVGVDLADADSVWRVDPERTLSALVADYRREWEDSRAAVARFARADTVPHPELGTVSVRWVLTHMIEETGRHSGHADILREQIDGAAGLGAAKERWQERGPREPAG